MKTADIEVGKTYVSSTSLYGSWYTDLYRVLDVQTQAEREQQLREQGNHRFTNSYLHGNRVRTIKVVKVGELRRGELSVLYPEDSNRWDARPQWVRPQVIEREADVEQLVARKEERDLAHARAREQAQLDLPRVQSQVGRVNNKLGEAGTDLRFTAQLNRDQTEVDVAPNRMVNYHDILKLVEPATSPSF